MSLSDYLHLAKPRIIPLLLFVGLGSAVVAGHSIPPVNVIVGILAGGGLTSAGSLAVNSYLERDIDGRMSRTKERPLPSGRINPPANAIPVAAVLLLGGVLSSYLLLNPMATLFIILGAIIYIPVYTVLLK